MIFVTLGTHGQPFARALRALTGLAGTEEMLVQHGATPPDPTLTDVRWADYLDWPQLTAALRAAEVVVCHAGVGSTITALRANRKPILIPRLLAHGEHVDDHQLQLADRFERAGWVFVARDGEPLAPLVAAARQASGTVALSSSGRLRAAVAAAAGGGVDGGGVDRGGVDR